MSCHILRNAIKAIIHFILFSQKVHPWGAKEREGKVCTRASPHLSPERKRKRETVVSTLSRKSVVLCESIFMPLEREREETTKLSKATTKGSAHRCFPLFVCVQKSFLSPSPPDTQIYGLLKMASSPPPFPPNTTSDKKYLFFRRIFHTESRFVPPLSKSRGIAGR